MAKKKTATLPKWANWATDGAIEIDPDVGYPLILKRLGGVKTATQYDLEVARRCLTTRLRELCGSGLHIRITNDAIRAGKKKWALVNFPPGKGADAGAQNFRKHYGVMRQVLEES